MTTQINDIHDLLRLLEERPDLAAELRQRILTPELLAEKSDLPLNEPPPVGEPAGVSSE